MSPDGTLLVSVGNDHTARVWDARTGTAQLVMAGHEGPVVWGALSTDGKTLATGSSNNDILVTKGYVDENDSVGVGLTGSSMTDTFLCKWDDGGTRLVDSIISESSITVTVPAAYAP